MRCEDCLPRVEEYLDGELGHEAAARVRAHLAACATCRDEHESLSHEREIYTSYARELELTPPSWAVVRARIEREKGRAAEGDFRPPRAAAPAFFSTLFGALFSRPAPLVAAALLLVVVFAAGVWRFLPGSSRVEPARIAAQDAPRADDAATPPDATRGDDVNVQKDVEADVADGGTYATSVTRGGPSDARVRSSAARPSSSRHRGAVDVPTETASASPPDGFVREAIASGSIENLEDAIEAYEQETGDAGRFVSESSGDADAQSSALHFERAQMLLRSLENLRQAGGRETLDISYAKRQSRRLLYRNTVLRQEAEASGDLPEREMLGSLEPLLLEIANLPERATQNDIRAVKERMRKGEIIAALQIHALAPQK
ncbi:MAG TPA: zf-HC2 domain-containing protein [Pyrinomonadaceae bacterium]|nr:zf-HC2 domain-containing protein [Pyrinomonadaceae bacterium]